MPSESDPSFTFFPDELDEGRSHRAPDPVAAGVPEPIPPRSLAELQWETSSTEFDPLSLFLPENPVPGSASSRALANECHDTSRHAPVPAIREISASSRVDPNGLDDLRTLLRETETALERSKRDAGALCVDVSQLRDLSAQIAQDYNRLSHICLQTEKRTEMASEALTAIENRLGPLEVVRDLINTTDESLASLSRRVEQAMSRAADFQAQKESITGVTELTATYGLPGLSEERVERLEQRAAEATASLERLVKDFDAQKQTIADASVEATRVTGILSELDARVASLAAHERLLGRAEETVGHLEQRAAQAAARLERVRKAEGELEHDRADTDIQPQARRAAAFKASGPALGRVQKRRADPRWAAAGLGALAVLTVVGMMVMRSRDEPAYRERTVRVTQRESPLSASTNGPAGRVVTMPTHDGASDARPSTNPVRHPAAVGVAPVPRTTDSLRHTGSAKEPRRPFIGGLRVESVPPGAAVFINQQRVGETPLQLPRLRAGSHAVWIEHEGYERWTTAVLVPAGKQTRVSAKLQPTAPARTVTGR